MLRNPHANKPTAEEIWYLSKEAVENPQAIIYRFYDTYGLMSPHEMLWEMLKTTLSSNEIDDWDSIERSNYLYFFGLLKDLINANYILYLKLREVKTNWE